MAAKTKTANPTTAPAEDSKYAEKIAKLLKQAESTTFPEEAQTALSLARQLMLQHHVEQADIDAASNKATVLEPIVDRCMYEVTRREQWSQAMARLIADNFRCKMYLSPLGRGKYRYMAMGHESDAILCAQAYAAAYTFAWRECWKYTYKVYRQGGKGRSREQGGQERQSWAQGFVTGLEEKFRLEKTALSQGQALMLIVPETVKAEYAGRQWGHAKPVQGVSDIDTAFAAGVIAGKGFDVNARTISA